MKQVLKVAKWSFAEWIFDVRQILILGILVCIANYTVMPLVRIAEDYQDPMNIIEPFLANVNSSYVILILLMCWIALVSDYPRMEGNNGYILIRIDRMTWLMGKICFLFMAEIWYIGELVFIFSIRAIHVCFSANGWSYMMMEFKTKYWEQVHEYGVVCLVMEQIYDFYRPYRALVETLLLLFGIFCMYAMIMMAASLLNKRLAGMVVNILLTLGGYLCINSGSRFCYWLPVVNVMLGEQTGTMMRRIPENYSILYFAVICGILFLCSMVLVKKCQIQRDRE